MERRLLGRRGCRRLLWGGSFLDETVDGCCGGGWRGGCLELLTAAVGVGGEEAAWTTRLLPAAVGVGGGGGMS